MRTASQPDLRGVDLSDVSEDQPHPKRLVGWAAEAVWLVAFGLALMVGSGLAIGLHRAHNRPACCSAQGAR